MKPFPLGGYREILLWDKLGGSLSGPSGVSPPPPPPLLYRKFCGLKCTLVLDTMLGRPLLVASLLMRAVLLYTSKLCL